MTSPFQQVVETLMRDVQNQYKPIPSITRKQLDDFEKEYIFDNLRESKAIGRAFCQKFDIIDYLLIAPGHKTYEEAINYIKKLYIK